ncbi:MAG: hypothetical protein LJE94_08030 [Deltaproteobacteria bacterium]|nr:hypothetical protein [Deltaproteobacteria bacterium]
MTIDDDLAREAGRRLSADYVLFGSITVLGSSTSIDARLVDVTGTKPTKRFFEQGEKMDDLMPKVGSLAADITAEMVGTAAVTAGAPRPGEAETTASSAGVEAIASMEYWKSRVYNVNIHGLALGDVDGDGKLKKIVGQSPWLYRVVDTPAGKGKRLLGQVFKPRSAYTAPVSAMGWAGGGDYHPQETIVSSKPYVVLGMAYGTLTAGGGLPRSSPTTTTTTSRSSTDTGKHSTTPANTTAAAPSPIPKGVSSKGNWWWRSSSRRARSSACRDKAAWSPINWRV